MAQRPRHSRPEDSSYDPMLDPLHAHSRGAGHVRSFDLGRVAPYYIGLFLLAPLIQYALTHWIHR